MTYRLAIPYLVISQNTRDELHWSQRNKDTQACERLIRWFGRDIPRATGPRSVLLTAYRVQRCADHANLVGGAKAACDALVRAGLLIDDRDRMARIAYDQHPLSRLEADDLARFGRVPVTVFTITDGAPS